MKRTPGDGLLVFVLFVLLAWSPLAVAAQTISLTQPIEVVSDSGVFTALAPDGWTVVVSDHPEDIDAMPLFATSDQAACASIAGADAVFPPDTVVIQVALPGALQKAFGLNLDVDVVTALDQIGPLIGADFGTDLHPLPGLEAPHAYITIRDWNYTEQGLTGGLLVVETDGGTLAFVMAYNTSADFAEQALAAIAASAQFVPTEEWTLSDGVFRFENPADGSVFTTDVPEGWFTDVANEDTPVLATSEAAAAAQNAGREGTLPPDSISIQVLLPAGIARMFAVEPGSKGQALIDALNAIFDPMYGPSQTLAGLDAPHALRFILDASGLPEGGNGALLLVDHGEGVSAWFVLFNGSQPDMEAVLAAMAQSVSYTPG